jgi:hypothetical protein
MNCILRRVRNFKNKNFTIPIYDFTGKLKYYEESDEHYKARIKALLKIKKGIKGKDNDTKKH